VRRRRKILLSALALLLMVGVLALGQGLPGMGGDDKKSGDEAPKQTSVEQKKEALTQKLEEEKPSFVRRMYLSYFSEYSPYRGLLLAVLTLVALLFLKKQSTRMLLHYIQPRAHKQDNADRFLRTWNTVWKVVIGILVVLALSGSLKVLGLSAAFLGMMLGWSLQAPVTGIAAWLMIILKKPFHVGDRIIIAGIIGDVTDITLTHIVLNQVGGTVGGEEPSGRAVLIPNAILFGQVIMNYTLQEQFMLDEVPVRLTFDSDWELAKGIMLEAATAVTEDIIKETGNDPFIRCEFFEAGVMVRLRYQSIPTRRQEFTSDITERVLAGFKKHYPSVKFCYPHNVIRYQWENSEDNGGEGTGHE